MIGMSGFDTFTYITKKSLMTNKVKIHGDNEIYKLFTYLAKYLCEKTDLYTAQNIMKKFCLECIEDGEAFYEHNGEAIMFLLENEYCHQERKTHSFIDYEDYIAYKTCTF